MRAFVGLPLPDDAADALERLQQDIPVGRIVAGEDLHLTLAFLDDQPEPVLGLLHQELAQIEAAPLELRISGLDLLGGRALRILVASVETDPALSRLHAAVRRAAQSVDFELPRKRFRPHITLARFPRQMPEHATRRLGGFLQAHGDFTLPQVYFDRMALYRSTLSPEGARYDRLATYAFAAAIGDEARGLLPP